MCICKYFHKERMRASKSLRHNGCDNSGCRTRCTRGKAAWQDCGLIQQHFALLGYKMNAACHRCAHRVRELRLEPARPLRKRSAPTLTISCVEVRTSDRAPMHSRTIRWLCRSTWHLVMQRLFLESSRCVIGSSADITLPGLVIARSAAMIALPACRE